MKQALSVALKINRFFVLFSCCLIVCQLMTGCQTGPGEKTDPEPPVAQIQCLPIRSDYLKGRYVTRQYDQNGKLVSYFSYIPASTPFPEVAATYTVLRNSKGKIIQLQPADPTDTRKLMLEYDPNGRWSITMVINPQSNSTMTVRPEYDKQGQITRIMRIQAYSDGPPADTAVTDYQYQDGNLVKQIDYIRKKPYQTVIEHDLTRMARYCESDSLDVYFWASRPLSRNPVRKLSVQTDIPGYVSGLEYVREYNPEGYVTKVRTISLQGTPNPDPAETHTYKCE